MKQAPEKDLALTYHSSGKPGKIEVVPTKPHSTQKDLSLAYSPGVAVPCLEIEKDNETAYEYTIKGNLVAVISNGTAVLGLGDIGALASKPVMEGKGLLFKIFSGIDVFDIEIAETDPDKLVDIVKAISPTFGGINLEDIKAPECFHIEERLKKELDIPVMHDDQHGTAIISSAGLINALVLANKKIEDIRLVVNGAGASGVACTKLYMSLGVKKENIVMCDSKGVVSSRRTDLNEVKTHFATDRNISTLADALKDADVFLGLSKADVLTQDMVRSMSPNPIVFALANPDPEISYDEAMASRPDIIFATGRSDYPNQVNNVLGFPYIFRGALDVRAKAINEEMKLAAVKALADLAKKPVLDVVNSAYGLERISFGREYIIPKPLDPRLITSVAMAVAKAAMDSGVARKPITDWVAYENQLNEMMGYSNRVIRQLTNLAKSKPKRIVFCEGNHINTVKAALLAKEEGICHPILIANRERLEAIAADNHLDLNGVEVIDHREPTEEGRRRRYAQLFAHKRERQGITSLDAIEMMNGRNYFGMMMVETGEADALISGVYSNYHSFARTAIDVIGFRPGYTHFAAMHILQTKKGPLFLADTLINRWPNQSVLTEIAKMTHDAVQFFNYEPVIAMLSFSNFGSDKNGSPMDISNTVRYLHENHPEIIIDGEMQVTFALNKELRDRTFPFNKLKGKDVNSLIFPNLSSGNITTKILTEFGISGDTIGPIQLGLNKPVHFADVESSVNDIFNLIVVAAVDAIAHEHSNNRQI